VTPNSRKAGIKKEARLFAFIVNDKIGLVRHR